MNHEIYDMHPNETFECTLLKWRYRRTHIPVSYWNQLRYLEKRIEEECNHSEFNKRYSYDPNTQKYKIKEDDSEECKELKRMSNIDGLSLLNQIKKEC
jgi:hypothetical protein